MAVKSSRNRTDVLLLNDETANHTYTISLNKKRAGTKIKICTKKKHTFKKSVTKNKKLAIKENEDIKVINTNVGTELHDSTSYILIRNSQTALTSELQVKENPMNQQPQIRLIKVTNKNLQGKPSFVILEDAEAKRRLLEAATDDISIRTEKKTTEDNDNDCSSTVASQTDDYLLRSALQDRIISSKSEESVIKSNAEQERFLQTHLKLEMHALRLRAERGRKISHVHNLANMSHIIPQEFVLPKPVSYKSSLYSTPIRRRPLQSSLFGSNRLTRRPPLGLKRKQTSGSQLLQSVKFKSSENNLNLTTNKHQDIPNHPKDQCQKACDQPKIEKQESAVGKKSIETKSTSRIPQESLCTNGCTWPKNDTNIPQQIISVHHLTKSLQETKDSPVVIGVGAPRYRIVNEKMPKMMRQENFILEQPQQFIVQSKHQLGQQTTSPQHPCFLQTTTQTNSDDMRPTYFVPPKQISNLVIDQNTNQQNNANTVNKNPIQMVNSHMWFPSCSNGSTSLVNAAGSNNTGSMQTVWSGSIQLPKQCPLQIMQYPSQYHIPYDQRTTPINNSSVSLESQYHQQLSAGEMPMHINSDEQFRETESMPHIRSEAQNFPIYYNQTCSRALQNLQHIRAQGHSEQSSHTLRPHNSQLNISPSQYCYGKQQAAPYTCHPQYTTPPTNRICNSKQKYCCGNGAMRSKNYRCTCSHCAAASNANSTALPDTLPRLCCYGQRSNLGGPTSTSTTGSEFSQNHYYARLRSGAGSYRHNFYYPPPNTCMNQFNSPGGQYNGKVPMTSNIPKQIQFVPMYPSFIAMQCQEFNNNTTTAMTTESNREIVSENQDEEQQGDNISCNSQLEGSSVTIQSNRIEGQATEQQNLIKRGPPPPVPPKMYKYVNAKSSSLRFPTHYGIRFERSCLILRAQPTPVPIPGKRVGQYDSMTD